MYLSNPKLLNIRVHLVYTKCELCVLFGMVVRQCYTFALVFWGCYYVIARAFLGPHPSLFDILLYI